MTWGAVASRFCPYLLSGADTAYGSSCEGKEERLTERKYGVTERVPRPRICSIWKGADSWGLLVEKLIFKKLRMD